MILNRYERMVARRYLLPHKGEGFIFVVAGISLAAVMLGVAALIIVMSVMNGFRAELFEKVTGLNGHAVVQGLDGRLQDWRADVAHPKGDVWTIVTRAGSLAALTPGSGNVAIGHQLARQLGLSVGSPITILSPEGRTTPFGTVPRIVDYNVAAIIETGLYDFDKAFVIMPMEDAQEFLMMGDAVGMVEVTTTDPDRVQEILDPLRARLANRVLVTDWRQMNSALFEAIQIERVVMFVVLSIIILVAAFNILSSLIMLVRAKHRDIAILRTMGASRRGVMKIFMTVGLSIGVLGIVAGMALGFVGLYFRQPVVNFFQGLTGQNLWDPEVRFLTELPSRIDPFEVTMIVLMALVLSFIATLIPAWRA